MRTEPDFPDSGLHPSLQFPRIYAFSCIKAFFVIVRDLAFLQPIGIYATLVRFSFPDYVLSRSWSPFTDP